MLLHPPDTEQLTATGLTDDDPPRCRIDVTDIISLGAERGSYHLNAAKHSVVLADSTYHGEIKVGITFTAAKVRRRQSLSSIVDARSLLYAYWHH